MNEVRTMEALAERYPLIRSMSRGLAIVARMTEWG